MQPNKILSRRDFLKLVSLVSLTPVAKPLIRLPRPTVNEDTPNFIILVFDAWSANHVQFYGYPRRTMPNIERFLERTIVFHNHYAAGTFTIPGTASLLTGLYPWTHRALSLGSGGMIDTQQDHQIFETFSDTHSTLAYTQNKFADTLLFQCAKYLGTHLKTGGFNLEHRFLYNSGIFQNDAQIAFASLEDNELLDGSKRASSLFLNPLFRLWRMSIAQENSFRYAEEYPLGLPDDTEQFLLSDVVDGAIRALQNLDEPGLAYFHFYPPHENYRPTQQFYSSFRTGWQLPQKPVHRLSWGKSPYSTINQLNQDYDAYIASWDAEVTRLFEYMDDSGLFERSYVIVTADHGELNERGERGHFTPLIFDPLIHIPLIVFQPGQKERRDVYAYTSAVDVLSTLAHLVGIPIPVWTEGELLPGLGGVENPERSLYSMDAKTNAAFAPLTKTSISLTKNRLRLTYYNYPGDQQFEFYDLEEDREEMNDLYPSQPMAARRMRDELLQKLDEVNQAPEL
jgi:arylsulfatase A-like enzyme